MNRVFPTYRRLLFFLAFTVLVSTATPPPVLPEKILAPEKPLPVAASFDYEKMQANHLIIPIPLPEKN